MKKQYYFLFVFILMVAGYSSAGAEEAKYKEVEKDGKFEIRDYSPQIVAEITMSGTFEDAGDEGSDLLSKYISGNNSLKADIPMTFPAEQQKVGEKWLVSFVMSALYTMKTLPKPKDSRISLQADSCPPDGSDTLFWFLERKSLSEEHF